ncbi:16S rRNA (cytosine(967)-C(5))-methyltransferase RsmB [Hornefia butyriciproducens]|uniref:16S rRNA (cytosine(967)-C(5))-methyltransferase RsmB n=1 Tax=Hornefia butyriciproducens TaxID=2652293 RepID=UPI0023F1D3EE|nr:16S rRNA (cytosine(967)-C(5))-methyltransferase RsmB [Hornefia butyriciproducens]MDD6299275.1 16S rRNA (cytosine(967)-C(5))-methyltransferase RsmB [Hornefia butyriciproducens]
MDINRKTAYYTLLRMEKNTSYSNIELNNQIRTMKPDSPAFVRDLVYGVLENKLYLDYLLEQLVKKGLRKLDAEPHVLLRMGIYQLMFMDSVPDYAAVNETVKMAKKFCFYQTKMINGVLRNFQRSRETLKQPINEEDPVKRLSAAYSFDPWITKLWLDQYGEERAASLMAASNLVPPFTVRVNTLKTTPEKLRVRLEERGVQAYYSQVSKNVLTLEGHGLLELPEYTEGLFFVQDAGSAASVEALEPRPGDTVIDVCAAPGGKSFVCAEMMENTGDIHSFDIYEKKIEAIEKHARRLGIHIIHTALNNAEKLRADLVETADKVICDVPCTGLGVVRRKPEIKYRKVKNEGRDLAKKQLQILQTSSKYLKKGGYIIYSTCTVNKIENADVVGNFLKNNSNFRLIHSRQLMPNGEGTDGFYYCKLKKKY